MLCLLADGHCLIEGFPGLAKTLTVSTTATVVRRVVHAPAVHARPRAGRPRRHAHLAPVDRGLRHRVGPGVRQHRARRRDQPRARQGAVGAARGDGRAPGQHRRSHASRCPTRSSCSPRRTRSSPRASTRCPRRSATASSCTSWCRTRRTRRSPPSPRRMSGAVPRGRAGAHARPAARRCRRVVEDVFVHHAVQDYAVRLVMTTRDPARWGLPDLAGHIALGASPRGTLGLIAAARALAVLRGRRYVVPAGRLRGRPRGAAPPHHADLRRARRRRPHRRRAARDAQPGQRHRASPRRSRRATLATPLVVRAAG